MKVRQGFVSNSSSSSYIVVVKGGFDKESFLNALKIAHDSPVANSYEKTS